ncbi:hypothetical protein SAMN05216276_11431, partial [Streptosporangium subroseum]
MKTAQVLAASVLALALAGLAGPAMAADEPDPEGVEVSVTIEPLRVPG